MTIAATITRRPGPLHEEIGQNAFDITAGDRYVIQWLAAREDVVGCEALLEHVLVGTGWHVTGTIERASEGLCTVGLVAED